MENSAIDDGNLSIRPSVFRRGDENFWCGINPDAAIGEFGPQADASESKYETILPVWDLRREALLMNPLLDGEKDTLQLYFVQRESFLLHNEHTDIYTHSTFLERSNSGRILRVIAHWIAGHALTPPIFGTYNGKFVKYDGHHRTAVAIIAKAPVIPLYCAELLDMQGVFPAPQSLLLNARWIAETVR